MNLATFIALNGSAKVAPTPVEMQQATFTLGVEATSMNFEEIHIMGAGKYKYVFDGVEHTVALENDYQGMLEIPEVDTESTITLYGEEIIIIDCGGNQLTELDVRGLTGLTEFDCSDNQLTELDVQGLTGLNKLYCQINQLTELNVQGLTGLTDFYCSNNQLTELNVQGLTKLTELFCSSNQLTELNVQGLTELIGLACSNNQLTELNVTGCVEIANFAENCDDAQEGGSTLYISGDATNYVEIKEAMGAKGWDVVDANEE